VFVHVLRLLPSSADSETARQQVCRRGAGDFTHQIRFPMPASVMTPAKKEADTCLGPKNIKDPINH